MQYREKLKLKPKKEKLNIAKIEEYKNNLIKEQGVPFFKTGIMSSSCDANLPDYVIEEFINNAKFFKTRSRNDIEHFNDSTENGYLCHENALLTAEHKNYKLVSGYIYNIVSKKFVWHCFNIDPQGYVYDSAPQGERSVVFIYYGIEQDIQMRLYFDNLDNNKKETEELFLDYYHSKLKDKKDLILQLVPDINKRKAIFDADGLAIMMKFIYCIYYLKSFKQLENDKILKDITKQDSSLFYKISLILCSQ
jgi:hypothetical protein